MTETLARPSRPVAGRRSADPEPGPAPSAVLSGALHALVAALLGLLVVVVPVLIVWWAEDRSGADLADAVRTGGQVWLVAHGASLELPDGTLGLTPLGLVAVPLLLLLRAGRRTGEALGARTVREAGRAALLVALPYAAVTGVVAAAAVSEAVRPAPVVAVLSALLLAVVVAGAGAVRAADAVPLVRPRIPERLRQVATAAGAAALVLLGVAALLVAVQLSRRFDAASELAEATSPGAVGGAGLLVLGVALAPNAVVWAASWLTGPGFAVGVGTGVSPSEVAVGPLPALPLTAALPGGPVPGAALVLLVPVLAGAVAGLVLHRRGGRVLDALAAGAGAGVLLAALAWLSGGPAGGERLTELGPSPLAVGAAFAAAVAPAAVAVLLLRRRYPTSSSSNER